MKSSHNFTIRQAVVFIVLLSICISSLNPISIYASDDLLGANSSSTPGRYGTLSSKPVEQSSLKLTDSIVSISSGAHHTCAVTASGDVWCWGANLSGKLGDGTTETRSTPVKVIDLWADAVAVTAGAQFTCALTSIGGVKCWGDGSYGQLGNGTFDDSYTPVNVSGLTSGVASISAGESHACAVTTSGQARCWGRGDNGQLGNLSQGNSNTPVGVVGLSGSVLAIAPGSGHTCALNSNLGIQCWGLGYNGQLGNGRFDLRSLSPVDVIGLESGASQIDSGEHSSCAVTALGEAKCWGRNMEAQLGDGTKTNRSTAVMVTGLDSEVSRIEVGSYNACVILNSGEQRCWGQNRYGEAGDGTTGIKLSPVTVSGLSGTPAMMRIGWGHVCDLLTTDSIQCWGLNTFGQLGDGTLFDSLFPVDVIGIEQGGDDNQGFIYLPLSLKNHMAVTVTEIQPDSNGVVEVNLPGGQVAEFMLIGDAGEAIDSMRVTSVADAWGVTLIGVDLNEEYIPTIVSVPAISLTMQSQSVAPLQINVDSRDWNIYRRNVQNYQLEEVEELHIEHLRALPANIASWENQHKSFELFFETAPWITVVSTLLTEGIKAALKEVAVHLWENYTFPDLAEVVNDHLHVNPIEEHELIVNQELGYAIDLGGTTASRGVIYGQVVDGYTNVGIPDVNVRLASNTSYTTRTLYNGWYQLEGVPAGNQTVQVQLEGFNNGSWISSSTFVVEGQKTKLVPTIELEADYLLHQVVVNGDFETGSSYPWQGWRGVYNTIQDPFVVDERPRFSPPWPADSEYVLKLGYFNSFWGSQVEEQFDNLESKLFIPAGTESASLSFLYRIEVSGDSALEQDRFTVDICRFELGARVCTPIQTFTNADETNDAWVSETIDLFAISEPDLKNFYPTRPYWLQFSFIPDDIHNAAITNMYIDDVEIQYSQGITDFGIWEIINDTGGVLHLLVEEIGEQTYNPGTYYWILPAGSYQATVWTTACGGTLDFIVEIQEGYIHSTTFYCAMGGVSELTAIDDRR